MSLSANLLSPFSYDLIFCMFLSGLVGYVHFRFQKNVNDAINPSGEYFLFGAVLFLGTFFVIFFTPETKVKQMKI